MEYAIEIESLGVSVKTGSERFDIVQDVSFGIKANQTLALVGESGSGKTTLAHAIVRLHSQKNGFSMRGKVLFEDKNLALLSEHELQTIRGAKISMIFQDPATSLNPVFSIGSQIAEVFELHASKDPEEIEYKTIQALAEVGLSYLEHPFHTYPHELSGGMKQRVMIAMALAMNPKVVIADEPTSALDLTVQKEILELLQKYRQTHGMAFLLITHDFNVVRMMAECVAVLYMGQCVEQATVDELFHNPAHPYTKGLLSCMLTPQKRKQMLPIFTNNATAPNSGCPFHSRCPAALAKCKHEKVPYFSLSDTHKVRCWLYEEEK